MRRCRAAPTSPGLRPRRHCSGAFAPGSTSAQLRFCRRPAGQRDLWRAQQPRAWWAFTRGSSIPRTTRSSTSLRGLNPGGRLPLNSPRRATRSMLLQRRRHVAAEFRKPSWPLAAAILEGADPALGRGRTGGQQVAFQTGGPVPQRSCSIRSSTAGAGSAALGGGGTRLRARARSDAATEIALAYARR